MLELSQIEVRYPARGGEIRAVRGVDLEVRSGELLGLVGESGCGKSTLGRAALRLEPIAGGRITAFGEEITAASTRQLRGFRQRAAMIFQDPYASFNPRRAVLDAITEPLALHRRGDRAARRARAEALLERVGLSAEMGGRKPHEMSGGQLQRVAIARALALEPELIVADEAVSALDVSVQAGVINLLLDLRRERGLTYLFIAHDLHLVAQICDRVAVMYAGKIVEIATPDRIFEAPRHPYTRALAAAAPVPDPRQPFCPPPAWGEPPDPRLPLEGCAFASRCPRRDEACAALPTLEGSGEGRVACHHPQG